MIKAITGEAEPGEFCYRTTPIFETGDERYAWFNTMVCVGVGNLSRSGVSYDIIGIL